MKHYSDEVIRGVLMERKRKAHNRKIVAMVIGAAVVGATLGILCGYGIDQLTTLAVKWWV